MALEKHVEATTDKATGKVKEIAGKVTDDKQLEAEGKGEGLLGKAKEAVEDAKGKVADVVDDIKDKLDDKH